MASPINHQSWLARPRPPVYLSLPETHAYMGLRKWPHAEGDSIDPQSKLHPSYVVDRSPIHGWLSHARLADRWYPFRSLARRCHLPPFGRRQHQQSRTKIDNGPASQGKTPCQFPDTGSPSPPKAGALPHHEARWVVTRCRSRPHRRGPATCRASRPSPWQPRAASASACAGPRPPC